VCEIRARGGGGGVFGKRGGGGGRGMLLGNEFRPLTPGARFSFLG